MKKGLIDHLIIVAFSIVFAISRFYRYITEKDTVMLVFAVLFILLAVVHTVRYLNPDSKYRKNVDKATDKDIRYSLDLSFTNTSTENVKDYASQLNLGRPTPYYFHIENKEFNRLYQKLLDNEWSVFLLPAKIIPGNTTVHSADIYGDNIIVEYGDKFNTTVRFIQNRKGLKTSDMEFVKLAENEYISETSTDEIKAGNYSVTQEVTVICSNTDKTVSKTVYSYSWNVGNYFCVIETICDMESKFNNMCDMIGSMNNIEVRENSIFANITL